MAVIHYCYMIFSSCLILELWLIIKFFKCLYEDYYGACYYGGSVSQVIAGEDEGGKHC